MKTDTSNVESPNSTAQLPANTIFELLLDEQRRTALHYLSGNVGAVPVDELTERIAVQEGESSRARLEEISTGFHHNHLPKLIDTAVVRYDPETGTVERRPEAATLDPYLDLVQRLGC